MSRQSRGARPAAPSSRPPRRVGAPARAGSGAMPTPAAARRSQPGRVLRGNLGAAPSGTLLKKIKGKAKNKIKPAQCPIPLKTEAASEMRPSAKLGAEAEAAGTRESLTMQLILALT